jgi:hypothetical protein
VTADRRGLAEQTGSDLAEQTGSDLADQTGGQVGWFRRALAACAKRWPTLLAVAITALTWGGAPLQALAQALLLFPLGYLAVSATGRRRISWPAAVLGIAALAALRVQDHTNPALVLILSGAVLVVCAMVWRRFWPPGDGLIQAFAWLAFVLLALLSVAVSPQVGKFVLAAGWLGHAVWDYYHWRADKGVSRSFAEWCGVYDLLGAIAILAYPAT